MSSEYVRYSIVCDSDEVVAELRKRWSIYIINDMGDNQLLCIIDIPSADEQEFVDVCQERGLAFRRL